jgi:toxin FitB
MILLDTNVISELWRIQPSRLVEQWLDAQQRTTLFISSMTLGELSYGALRLTDSKRRSVYLQAISKLEQERFEGRILPFDRSCAAAFGQIMATREQMERRVQTANAVIAAIAKTNGMSLATRNLHDFDDLGLAIINPFEPQT